MLNHFSAQFLSPAWPIQMRVVRVEDGKSVVELEVPTDLERCLTEAVTFMFTVGQQLQNINREIEGEKRHQRVKAQQAQFRETLCQHYLALRVEQGLKHEAALKLVAQLPPYVNWPGWGPRVLGRYLPPRKDLEQRITQLRKKQGTHHQSTKGAAS